uniref:GIY-YIG domain-containing protein n=1 Tax=Paulinella micropora TaxID=1928728 RepID=A0A385I122_9EUKA|nr:hypothetical protein PMNZ_701 [Paulinella micropora]AXY63622.1 hypothetical protein PMNZ_701 [Paulinella micropora]
MTSLMINDVASNLAFISGERLIEWQNHLVKYQQPLFNEKRLLKPQCLAYEDPYCLEKIHNYASSLNLLSISPQRLNFWYWPSKICYGPAIYFVIDHPPHLDSPILLYIGETGQAEKRWKGNHACKNYLAAYSEAVYHGQLQENLTIRFWTDVPNNKVKRRFIEEILIDIWRPGFNKVIYQRWYNTFIY